MFYSFFDLRNVGTPLPGRPEKVSLGTMSPGKVAGMIRQTGERSSPLRCTAYLSARRGGFHILPKRFLFTATECTTNISSPITGFTLSSRPLVGPLKTVLKTTSPITFPRSKANILQICPSGTAGSTDSTNKTLPSHKGGFLFYRKSPLAHNQRGRTSWELCF